MSRLIGLLASLGRRNPKALIAALVLGTAVVGGTKFQSWNARAWNVAPVNNAENTGAAKVDIGASETVRLPSEDLIQLSNLGYKVGYSVGLRNPIWVMYSLHSGTDYSGKRPKTNFEPDSRVPNPVVSSDYTNSGYDRGHMAPSYAIGKVWGPDAQLETFLLTNITPQKHEMNDGVWNSIERMEMDDFAKRFGKIKVVCGPIFANPPPKFPSGVAVPEAFFKAIQRPDGETIAFIVPQEPTSPKPESYLVSVKEIARLTNIDLFPEAPDRERKRTKIW